MVLYRYYRLNVCNILLPRIIRIKREDAKKRGMKDEGDIKKFENWENKEGEEREREIVDETGEEKDKELTS